MTSIDLPRLRVRTTFARMAAFGCGLGLLVIYTLGSSADAAEREARVSASGRRAAQHAPSAETAEAQPLGASAGDAPRKSGYVIASGRS